MNNNNLTNINSDNKSTNPITETESKHEINILPFIIQAFALNTKIHSDIDKIYQSDKIHFYNLSHNHEIYNHPIFKEGSIIQEEYSKKILGILLSDYNIEPLVKKGWHYTYTYFQSHNTIDFLDFTQKYIKKYKGFDNVTETQLDSQILIMIMLINSSNTKKTIIKNDFLYDVNKNLLSKQNFYESGRNQNIQYKYMNKENKQSAEELYNRIVTKYNLPKHFTNFHNLFIDNPNMIIFFDKVNFIFDIENNDIMNIFESVEFTNKDVIEILNTFPLESETINNRIPNKSIQLPDIHSEQYVDEAFKYLLHCTILKYLLKNYNQLKEYYRTHNQESMFF